MKKIVLFVSALQVLFLSATSFSASWWGSEDYYHGQSQLEIYSLVPMAEKGLVLFIDTREESEFVEGHIPGAINIPLRKAGDIDQERLEQFKEYSYVVPYCLKDFRGFEVARKLMASGLENVVMMNPAGLKGWQKKGLPVTQQLMTVSEAKSEFVAWRSSHEQ